MAGSRVKTGRIALLLFLLAGVAGGIVGGCTESETLSSSGPMLAVSATSLNYISQAGNPPNPAQRKIVVSNSGTGTLSFSASATASWVDLSLIVDDTIFVTIRSETLAPGDYVDTLIITSQQALNSPRLVEINLTVLERIAASPSQIQISTLAKDANPGPIQVILSAAGGTQIDYTVITTASWLNLSSTSGTTPDTLVAQIDITGLSPGIYVDSLSLRSPMIPGFRSLIPITLDVDAWRRVALSADTSGNPLLNLRELQIFGDSSLWASGYRPGTLDPNGILVRSTNRGWSWTILPDAPDGRFYSAYFYSATTGFFVGDSSRLAVTTNSGNTWRLLSNLPIDSTLSLSDIKFVGSDRGWIVGNDGLILASPNGGGNWLVQSSPTAESLTEVLFVDELTGWASGLNGTIIHTDDGGNSWHLQSSGSPSDLFGLAFVSASEGWMVGADGRVIHTTNGGQLWQGQSSGVTDDLYGVAFVDNLRGWAVGQNGTIIATTNGGQSWNRQESNATGLLFAVKFFDADQGVVTGDNGVALRTLSGGR